MDPHVEQRDDFDERKVGTSEHRSVAHGLPCVARSAPPFVAVGDPSALVEAHHLFTFSALSVILEEAVEDQELQHLERLVRTLGDPQ